MNGKLPAVVLMIATARAIQQERAQSDDSGPADQVELAASPSEVRVLSAGLPEVVARHPSTERGERLRTFAAVAEDCGSLSQKPVMWAGSSFMRRSGFRETSRPRGVLFGVLRAPLAPETMRA